ASGEDAMDRKNGAGARFVWFRGLCLAAFALWMAYPGVPTTPGAEKVRSKEPLKLHPDNPHYFLFRGKPAVLITSGQHYGAVLNRDFDYVKYLEELKSRGLNLTRTFSGTYREIPGSFKIVDNTLAPKSGRYVCPWARSATRGASDGGSKFDLTT